MRNRIVPELHNPGMSIERGLNDRSLHASTSAVDQPNLMQAGVGRRIDIVGHDAGNVARRERVESELRFDRDFQRQLYFCLLPFAFLL